MTKTTGVVRLTPKQLRLIRHLLTLVNADGSAQLSFREIAEKADTSHTTVYRIFHGKIYKEKE